MPREGMRRRREELGFTQEHVALSIGVAVSTFTAWELGTRRITVGFRPKLARVLDVTLSDVAGWFDPVRVAPDGVSPNWLGTFAALEQGASELWTYEPIAIPGLLQTADYAAAVERQAIDTPTDAEIDRWVRLRLGRQQVLDRHPDPLRLSVVLDESVVLRQAGGDGTMADQLDHLAAMAARPNVDVRVLPLKPGTHLAAFGSFTLLASPGTTEPYMVVMLDRGSAHYFERREAVALHTELFRHLRDVALSPTESIDLLRSTAQEYRP